MTDNREDPAVASARREALVVLVLFLVAMFYTVLYCFFSGYHRDPETLRFIFGFPDWVFWGIVCPWGVCLLISYWFGHTYMRDADLGPSVEEDSDGLGGRDG